MKSSALIKNLDPCLTKLNQNMKDIVKAFYIRNDVSRQASSKR